MQEHSGDGITYDPVMLWWPLTCVNAMEIDVVGKGKTVRSHVNIMMIGNDRIALDLLVTIEPSAV
jgi:hypothetical protein